MFVLLWFAWFPMHAVFAVSCTKDVLFAAFFLYFTVFLVRLVFDGEAFAWYSYGGMVASGVLSVLMRNNALYAILAGGVVILLLGTEEGEEETALYSGDSGRNLAVLRSCQRGACGSSPGRKYGQLPGEPFHAAAMSGEGGPVSPGGFER